VLAHKGRQPGRLTVPGLAQNLTAESREPHSRTVATIVAAVTELRNHS
jgi:hypothetical protein